MNDFSKIFIDVNRRYDDVKLLKKSEKGGVFSVREKETKKKFILRYAENAGDIYKKLMSVSSPHLPKILSVEEKFGMTEILEEFVQGDTLYYLLLCDKISPEETKRIIIQICEGLKILHNLDIIHRDIKPENVILRGDEAVLIDFDASRMVTPEKETDTKILGTTGYAAPEQYGLSQTDARSDIYSLGVLMNVMLTGEHPSTKLASGYYLKVIEKCTMISPEKRYQDADEMISAIKSAKQPKMNGKKWFVVLAAVVIVIIAAILIRQNDTEPLPQEPEHTEFDDEYLQPKKTDEDEEPVYSEPETEEEEQNSSDDRYGGYIEILPDDFYDYWTKSEIVREEQISVSVPGNTENFFSYAFEDGVLNVVVQEIPQEEFEKEDGYNPGDELYIEIAIEAPSDDIEWIAFNQGNGPTYSNLKKQIANGEELYYSTYDEGYTAITDRPFAKVVMFEGEYKFALYETGQLFYAVMVWRDAEGNVETQILPYRILTENLVKNKDSYWMDAYWKPVSDPERIIFREVHGDYEYKTEKELEDAGLELEIFKEPGTIEVNRGKISDTDIGVIANAEAYLLAPDASPIKEGESIEEWIDRTNRESKYTGYRCCHFDGGIWAYETEAKRIEQINSTNVYFNIKDSHSRATNILLMDENTINGTAIWTTRDVFKNIIMVIDWYTENPEENPFAKPAKREYIRTDVESMIFYESNKIISGGYCGAEGNETSVTWVLNTDGTLRISGKGPMEDYSENRFDRETNSWINLAPWGEFSEQCKTLVIDEGITVIGKKAFLGMENLSEKLVIPKSVTEIKSNAFLGCGFDCDLVIPGTVDAIGENAFAQWNKGKAGELILEEGVEHLGSNAFYGGNFYSVKLPSTLRDIEASAFDSSNSLTELVIDKNNQDICVKDGVIYTADMKILVEVLSYKSGKFIVPDEVEIIGLGAFQSSNVHSVTLNENIKVIEKAAFHGYSGKIIIKGTPEKIAAYAFYPAADETISVYFYSEPTKNVFEVNSKSPSFYENKGNIEIYVSRKFFADWPKNEDGTWLGYEIKQF